MIHSSQYDRCRCGRRKLKASARCTDCHRLHQKAADRARTLALAAAQGETVVVVVKKRDDLVRLARAVQALRVFFAAELNNSEQLQLHSF